MKTDCNSLATNSPKHKIVTNATFVYCSENDLWVPIILTWLLYQGRSLIILY